MAGVQPGDLADNKIRSSEDFRYTAAVAMEWKTNDHFQ